MRGGHGHGHGGRGQGGITDVTNNNQNSKFSKYLKPYQCNNQILSTFRNSCRR